MLNQWVANSHRQPGQTGVLGFVTHGEDTKTWVGCVACRQSKE